MELHVLELKIRKIGDALGLVLPEDLLASLDAREGDALFASVTSDGGIALTPYDPTVAEQVDAARDLAKRYRNALRELAK
jgi:putative addiction module antidote